MLGRASVIAWPGSGTRHPPGNTNRLYHLKLYHLQLKVFGVAHSSRHLACLVLPLTVASSTLARRKHSDS